MTNLSINMVPLVLRMFFLTYRLPSPLATTMNYLLQSLRSKERSSDAFITIGLASIAVEGNIKSYLPKIMELVRSALPSKVASALLIDSTMWIKCLITYNLLFICVYLSRYF